MVMGRNRRGLSVAAVLVMAALIFMLALAVSGASFFHLNLSSRASQEATAQNLAESAVSKVIERVLKRESDTGELDYGEDNQATVEVTHASAPADAFGLATFQPNYQGPRPLSPLPCLNNLRSDSSVSASNGNLIPREALYLVGYGVCGNVTRRVEAVVYLPRFPYSVACQGPFRGSELLIAGVEKGKRVIAGQSVAPEDLKAGHLASNSTLGDQAVALTGDNRVKGNVQSVSGASLGPNTIVEGSVILGAREVQLPTLDLESYRPTLDDPSLQRGLTSLERNLHLNETAYFQGSQMTVLDGLTLDGGVLFVDGDLSVHGGVHGKGALIVTGEVRVNGSGSVATDNVVALLVGGDVRLRGSGQEPKDSVFEGLLYSEGHIDASNLTLVGTLISRGDAPSQFRNSIVLQQDGYSAMLIESTRTTPSSDPRDWSKVSMEAEADIRNIPNSLTYRGLTPSDDVATQAALESTLGRPLSAAELRDFREVFSLLGQSAGGPTGQPYNGLVVVQSITQGPRTTVSGGSTNSTQASQTTSTTHFSVDLSDLVGPLDRMRVLWWRNI